MPTTPPVPMSCGHKMRLTEAHQRLREQGQPVRCPRCGRLVLAADEIGKGAGVEDIRKGLARGNRR